MKEKSTKEEKDRDARGRAVLADAFTRLEQCNLQFAKIVRDREKACGCIPLVGVKTKP